MPSRTHGRTYVDAVGASTLTRVVRDAYLGALDEGWGDPARLHTEGRRARSLLDGAREEIAALLGSPPAHTHFAPSPAVAIQRIVLGIGAARRGRFRAIVSAVEAPALLGVARRVATEVESIPVDATARVDMDRFARSLVGGDVAFAALQHASGEVGTIQPLDEAYAATLVAKIPLVVDATTSLGHVDPPSAWDALVADPANWGGPGGMGVLALKPELRWLPAWSDGAPWAPGSVNVPAAVAAAVALRYRERGRTRSPHVTRRLAEQFTDAVRRIPDTVVLGHPTIRLPHVVTATFVYAQTATIVDRLDRAGYSVGGACTCWRATEPTCPTLVAMGTMTHGVVRFGLHAELTAASIDGLSAALRVAVESSRADLGAPR